MTFQFTPSDEVARIRSRLDHPIVDGDGHLVEFLPLVLDLVREEADASVARRFEELLLGLVQADRLRHTRARAYWALPERNTLDRMTVTLPELLYRRLDEIGLDYVLLYPSSGLAVMGIVDDEVRRAAARALNRYYAQEYAGYRDRLEPVAVIPTFTPEEARAELDHAVGELGLKAVVMSGVIPRTRARDGSAAAWTDTLGFESLYDYDPVWAKCQELGVVPTFHGVGYGWGTRNSPANYVYNHIGSFAAAQEATCRSLLLGGVPRRFPALRFAFLEGGVAWACQLYADALGHWEKRNREAVRRFDPREFDLRLCAELLDRFARGRILERRKLYEEGAARAKAAPADDPGGFDDFAQSGIERAEDIVDIFTRQFYFGCEGDDRLNALAFDRRLLPHGARLNAVFASDIGHWDVSDLRRVLPDACELVEDGVMSDDDFREFACANAMRMLSAGNPRFFEETAVAEAARKLVPAAG
jgi:predicted TIM-barrel fold metal-dependent hydrolase